MLGAKSKLDFQIQQPSSVHDCRTAILYPWSDPLQTRTVKKYRSAIINETRHLLLSTTISTTLICLSLYVYQSSTSRFKRIIRSTFNFILNVSTISISKNATELLPSPFLAIKHFGIYKCTELSRLPCIPTSICLLVSLLL